MKTNNIERRRLLQSGAVAISAVVAGCNGVGQPESGDSDVRVTPPSEQEVAPGSATYYTEIREALLELSRPWEQTATEAAEGMADSLKRELADLLRPGIRDALPGDNIQIIIEETVFAFRLLEQQQASFAREQLRADVKAIPTSEIREYYSDLGYSWDNVVDRPYYPLFLALADGLRKTELDGSQQAVSSLQSDADTVHTLLSVYIFPRVKDYIPDESSTQDVETDGTVERGVDELLKTSL